MERKVGKTNYRVVGKMFLVLCAVLLSLYYAVDCKAVSWPFSNGNSLENACLWVRDDGYYFTPDISADEVEERTITNEHVIDMWPEEIIVTNGDNYAFAGDGESDSSEDKAGEILYFFTNIADDSETGTLNYINKRNLYIDGKIDQSIVVVDNDVCILRANFLIQDDGRALYQKKTDLGSTLYYFDGKDSFQIAENVDGNGQLILDKKIAYYVRSDENGQYIIFAKNVDNPESEKIIVTDFHWINDEGERSDGEYYFNNGNVFYVKNNNLCMNSYNSDEVIISENIGEIISAEKNEIVYTKYTQDIKLIDFIDFSESEYNAENIELINSIEEDSEVQLGRVKIYSYDLEKKFEKAKFEKQFLGVRVDGKEKGSFYSNSNFYILDDSLKNISETLGKTSFNDIVSQEQLSSKELIAERIADWRDQQLELLRNGISIHLSLVTFADEIKVYPIDTLLLSSWLNAVVSIAVPYEYDGKNSIDILLDGKLYSGIITEDGMESSGQTGWEGVRDIQVVGNKLIYFQDDNVSWSWNGHVESLGQRCAFWKGYEDGSALLLVSWDKVKYGGTLWYINENNMALEIDSEVKKFAKLESGGFVYLAGNNLILYEDGIKTRIADHVNSFRLFKEKKKTESRYSVW